MQIFETTLNAIVVQLTQLSSLVILELTLGPLERRHRLLQLLCGERTELLEAHEGHVAEPALLRVLRHGVVMLASYEDHAVNLFLNNEL